MVLVLQCSHLEPEAVGRHASLPISDRVSASASLSPAAAHHPLSLKSPGQVQWC